jgi:hypothetical protein
VGGFLLKPQAVMTPLSKMSGFDAQKAPVLSVDAHLPAVPHERMQEVSLRARFMAPPVWQPEISYEIRHVIAANIISKRQAAGKVTRAAVLIPLLL